MAVRLYRKPKVRKSRPLPEAVEKDRRRKKLIAKELEQETYSEKGKTKQLKAEMKKQTIFHLEDFQQKQRSIVEDKKDNSYYCSHTKEGWNCLPDNASVEVYSCLDEDRDIWTIKKFLKSFLVFVEELPYEEEISEEEMEAHVSKIAIDAKYDTTTTTIIEDEEEKEVVEKPKPKILHLTSFGIPPIIENSLPLSVRKTLFKVFTELSETTDVKKVIEKYI